MTSWFQWYQSLVHQTAIIIDCFELYPTTTTWYKSTPKTSTWKQMVPLDLCWISEQNALFRISLALPTTGSSENPPTTNFAFFELTIKAIYGLVGFFTNARSHSSCLSNASYPVSFFPHLCWIVFSPSRRLLTKTSWHTFLGASECDWEHQKRHNSLSWPATAI